MYTSMTTCYETVIDRRWKRLPSGAIFSRVVSQLVAAHVILARGSCVHGGLYLTMPIAPCLCLYGCERGYNFSSVIGSAQVFLYGSLLPCTRCLQRSSFQVCTVSTKIGVPIIARAYMRLRHPKRYGPAFNLCPRISMDFSRKMIRQSHLSLNTSIPIDVVKYTDTVTKVADTMQIRFVLCSAHRRSPSSGGVTAMATVAMTSSLGQD